MKWNYIIEILSIQFVVYCLLRNIFMGKIRKSIIFCPIVNILIIFALQFADFHEIIFLVADVFLYFILPQFFIKGISRLNILYFSLLCVGLYSAVIALTFFICTFLNINGIATISNIFYIGFSLLFCLLSFSHKCSNKLHSLVNNFTYITKTSKATLLVFIWLLFALINSITVLFTISISPNVLAIFCSLLLLVFTFSFILLYLLITSNIKNTYYKKLNNTIQANMAEQIRHYKQLNKANESLKKFRHDYNNIKIGLTSLLKENNVIGAINYLNDCDNTVNVEYVSYNTGHTIVDALLSDKAFKIKENNIKITFNGILPADVLTPVDLCIIFGNTLDNAIESCQNIKDNNIKTIAISVKQNHDYIFLTFTNPTTENVLIKDNTIISTKKDKYLHGIGLYSIKQVLKKYDGHLELSCNDNLFTTKIDFCILNEQEKLQ